MSRTAHFKSERHMALDSHFAPDAPDLRLSHGALHRPYRRARPLPPTRRQRMERFVRRLLAELFKRSTT